MDLNEVRKLCVSVQFQNEENARRVSQRVGEINLQLASAPGPFRERKLTADIGKGRRRIRGLDLQPYPLPLRVVGLPKLFGSEFLTTP